jgi:hypothetical protein
MNKFNDRVNQHDQHQLQPEFLEVEESNKILDKEMYKIGVGYMTFAALGGGYGFLNSFRNGEKGGFRIRLNSILNNVTKYSIKTANQAAVICKFFFFN